MLISICLQPLSIIFLLLETSLFMFIYLLFVYLFMFAYVFLVRLRTESYKQNLFE